MNRFSLTLLTAMSITVAGCATTPRPDKQTALPKSGECENGTAKLDSDFPAGNAGTCSVSSDGQFNLTLAPEDAPPINCSAWYAFRLTPGKAAKATDATVKLNYEACGHRYWPKISADGKKWDFLPKTQVEITKKLDRKTAKITLKLGSVPVFVAAQEIFVPSNYDAWLGKVSSSPDAERSLLGKSAEGREIPMLSIKAENTQPKEQVILVGRQHPPELTGALGLVSFVETILSGDPIAVQYRARFETIIVPILNPDGVVHGHWRHNVDSTDLNRDWGPFKQPETRLMDGLLQSLESDPDKKLRFFADFHSTQNDIFYTIPDEFETTPKLFIRDWLARLGKRMPDYEVKRSENQDLTQANSKNYVYRRYGVPTVTYEMGDETDRALISKIGKEAALAMMETLLATKETD